MRPIFCLGTHLGSRDPLPPQIVGLVGDIRQDSLESAPTPAVYFRFANFRKGHW